MRLLRVNSKLGHASHLLRRACVRARGTAVEEEGRIPVACDHDQPGEKERCDRMSSSHSGRKKEKESYRVR